MVSPGNQHCANCIGALSFRVDKPVTLRRPGGGGGGNDSFLQVTGSGTWHSADTAVNVSRC